MILVIDNYDSFVHNLARYFEREGESIKIVRNDAITVDEIRALSPSAIILSPGPCGPYEAGICMDVVRELGAIIPILGVCLGHQVIGEVYGGSIRLSNSPTHGKATQITHNAKGLFHNLPAFLNVGRYHSLISDVRNSDELIIDAVNNEKINMAMHHKTYPVYGVQFHPESILTEFGADIVRNFIAIAKSCRADGKLAA